MFRKIEGDRNRLKPREVTSIHDANIFVMEQESLQKLHEKKFPKSHPAFKKEWLDFGLEPMKKTPPKNETAKATKPIQKVVRRKRAYKPLRKPTPLDAWQLYRNFGLYGVQNEGTFNRMIIRCSLNLAREQQQPPYEGRELLQPLFKIDFVKGMKGIYNDNEVPVLPPMAGVIPEEIASGLSPADTSKWPEDGEDTDV